MKRVTDGRVKWSTCLFFLALCCPGATLYSQVFPQEREALIALYSTTDGDSWDNNSGWLGEAGTECSWFGVGCAFDNTVSLLNLAGNNLNGLIPAEIGNLNRLRFLFLGSNQLSGPIPPELGKLSRLSLLDLGANQLAGAIPAAIGNLVGLTTLHFFANQFSGSIPAEIADIPGLVVLDLQHNQLAGVVPPMLLTDTRLSLLLEGNSALTWGDWPSAFNGVVPDPKIELEFNNIGTLNLNDGLIYTCLNIVTNGLQDSIAGLERLGVAFAIDSVAAGVVRVVKSREFNKGRVLTSMGEQPDCSGIFETTTNIYTDHIEANEKTYSVSFELFDELNLILRTIDLIELRAAR